MKTDCFEQLDGALRQRLAACRDRLRSIGRLAVAFSAGVDSTFLLALAVETLGSENVLAVMGISPSLAARERASGAELARKIGAELVEIDTCELDDPNYASNPTNRCFYCKQDLLTRVAELARQRGYDTVATGANADDTGDFRPGLQAGKQLGAVCPLMEAGLTKDDIRAASRAMDLPTWDKPAMACLASRIPYGQPITAERLARVEQAEYVLKDLGFATCRVRDHDTVARIEVPPDDVPRIAELGDRIAPALKRLGYTYVTVDLQGFRSGSMNETLASTKTSQP